MITEQQSGEKPVSNSSGLIERVGGGVLDFALPGREYGPFFAKTVGVATLAVSAVVAFEMAWLLTLNTGAEQ